MRDTLSDQIADARSVDGVPEVINPKEPTRRWVQVSQAPDNQAIFSWGRVRPRWNDVTVNEQNPALDVSGHDDSPSFSLRYFGEIRQSALKRWDSARVDDDGEPWECRWQLQTQKLVHEGHNPVDCGGLHVAIYCSLNDAADHLVDLLTDERLDLNRFGTLPGGQIAPDPQTPNEETARLFRFYVRVLWVAEVFLEDLQQLLALTNTSARTSKDLRGCLGRGAPLGVDPLRGFINTIGKHALRPSPSRPIRGMHCWNHHCEVYFADADVNPSVLAELNAFTLGGDPKDGHVYDAVVMPRLVDIVDTVAAALVNLDKEVNQPQVIERLAGTYGRCWPE